MNQEINQLVLQACIAEVKSIRYTPSGLPALDLRIEHESKIIEAGQERQVSAGIKAVAFGALAETLVKLNVGSVWKFTGFLATPRNSKNVVFHIQELTQN